MPNSKKLARIEREAVHGRIDTVPLITWGGWEVRRYRDQLFLDPVCRATDPIGRLPWHDKQLLELPDGLGRLIVESSVVGISATRWRQGEVDVRFRRGGERCQPAGQAHHRPLKKLLQEWSVPPWERDRLPLIYVDGALAAIPGRINCQPFMALPGEEAIQVRWEKAPSENWSGYLKD